MIETNNERARDAWNTNASFWDRRMGDGNDFFEELVWPSVARLFCPREGEQLLDVACGNGVTCRRLVRAGAKVLGVDFSEEMIRHAKERHADGDVDYRVLDATNPEALRVLGSGSFDGALCNMALMDVADSRALMTGVRSLLKPTGRFVFSVLHPCFNNPATVQMGELEDRQGTIVTTYSVKVSRYLTRTHRLAWRCTINRCHIHISIARSKSCSERPSMPASSWMGWKNAPSRATTPPERHLCPGTGDSVRFRRC